MRIEFSPQEIQMLMQMFMKLLKKMPTEFQQFTVKPKREPQQGYEGTDYMKAYSVLCDMLRRIPEKRVKLCKHVETTVCSNVCLTGENTTRQCFVINQQGIKAVPCGNLEPNVVFKDIQVFENSGWGENAVLKIDGETIYEYILSAKDEKNPTVTVKGKEEFKDLIPKDVLKLLEITLRSCN